MARRKQKMLCFSESAICDADPTSMCIAPQKPRPCQPSALETEAVILGRTSAARNKRDNRENCHMANNSAGSMLPSADRATMKRQVDADDEEENTALTH